MGRRIYNQKRFDTATQIAVTKAKIANLEENVLFDQNHIRAMSLLAADLNLVTSNNEQHILAARERIARMENDLQIQRDELSRLLSVEGNV